MTHLRKLTLDEIARRNYTEGTTCAYLRIIEELARYFHRSPDQLGPEQLREYTAHLFRDRKLSDNSVNQIVGALRFFFRKVLKRPWTPCRVINMAVELAEPVWCTGLNDDRCAEPFRRMVLGSPARAVSQRVFAKTYTIRTATTIATVISARVRRARGGEGMGPKGAPHSRQFGASSLATELHL